MHFLGGLLCCHSISATLVSSSSWVRRGGLSFGPPRRPWPRRSLQTNAVQDEEREAEEAEAVEKEKEEAEAEAEAALYQFWRGHGITSRTHLHGLVNRAQIVRRASLRDPGFLSSRLRAIARVVKEDEQAAEAAILAEAATLAALEETDEDGEERDDGDDDDDEGGDDEGGGDGADGEERGSSGSGGSGEAPQGRSCRIDAEDVAAAAQLVARAPALLGYDPETVADKLRTLREYFVGVDVSTMVRRQPSLLLRDVDIAVPLKLGILLEQFGDGELVARLVERNPSILFLAADTLASRVDDLAALLLDHSTLLQRDQDWLPYSSLSPPPVDEHGAFDEEEEEEEEVSRRRRSKELARRILSKAPSLFSYRLDTIAATVQQWTDFDLQRDDGGGGDGDGGDDHDHDNDDGGGAEAEGLPQSPETLDLLWCKVPSLLTCDFETTISPKLRILRGVMGGNGNGDNDGGGGGDRDDPGSSAGLVRMLVANPTYLGYSRIKFGRLLFEAGPGATRIDPSHVRATLRSDKNLEAWLKRTGHPRAQYAAWLGGRLDTTTTTSPLETDIAITGDGAGGTDGGGGGGGGGDPSAAELGSLEKAHGAALAAIELALDEGNEGR